MEKRHAHKKLREKPLIFNVIILTETTIKIYTKKRYIGD